MLSPSCAPRGRRDRAGHAGRRLQLREDGGGVRVVLDEYVERLHHAGCDPGGGESGASGDCVAAPGQVFCLRLARVQLKAGVDEHADDRDSDRSDRDRPAHHERRPLAPEAVLGMATVDEALRQHADAVDPGAEHRQQRRQQRDRHEHRDGGDQHAADSDRTDERQRQDDHRQQSHCDGRAGDDHRAARVRHRLDERGLDVLALSQLVTEPEDHQQRVVDRDAEADQCDQELHDDRHVRDVGQRPDKREGVENRGDRDRDRHQHGRQRAEDEEENHQRAEAADQSFGEHARPVAPAGGGLDWVASGQVHGHAGRDRCLQRGARRLDEVDTAEVGHSARVDRRERRVPVLRDVDVAAGREVGADARLGVHRLGACDRLRDPWLLGDVAARCGRRRSSAPALRCRRRAGCAGSLRRPTPPGSRTASASASRPAEPRTRRRPSARSRRRSRAGDGARSSGQDGRARRAP